MQNAKSGRNNGPGTGRKLELYCAQCRYGVVVRVAPDVCPMCLNTAWVIRRVLPAASDS
jgi:hypothetical protein